MEGKYKKKCVCCKREYYSNARGQRFCSETCQKNYQKKLKKERLFYSETKELRRLKARSHAIAVEVKQFEYHQQDKPWVCEICGAPAEEVHHKSVVWLDNSPDNLQVLCKKCHAEIHKNLPKNSENESFRKFIGVNETF